jgi:methyl-accepting chemotaxis protein
MALRIAGLPVLSPSEVAAGARSLLGWTDEAVQAVADLPARVAALVDEAERLVARVGAALDRVDAAVQRVDDVVTDVDTAARRVDGVVGRVDGVVGDAQGLVGRVAEVAEHADTVASGAGGVVDRADSVARTAESLVDEVGATGRGAQELLDLYRPAAERAAPLVSRFVEAFSETELRALIRLVDQVPRFTEHMESDIMPILATLDRVGPDVHELLDVLKDVRQALLGVPGFKMLRRRGAEKEDEI